jgi:hypothetical protein
MHICIPHVDKKLGLEKNKAKQTEAPHSQGIKSKGVIFGFVHDKQKNQRVNDGPKHAGDAADYRHMVLLIRCAFGWNGRVGHDIAIDGIVILPMDKGD